MEVNYISQNFIGCGGMVLEVDTYVAESLMDAVSSLVGPSVMVVTVRGRVAIVIIMKFACTRIHSVHTKNNKGIKGIVCTRHDYSHVMCVCRPQN